MWYSIVEMCMGFIKLQHKSSVFWVIVLVGIVRQTGRHIIASSCSHYCGVMQAGTAGAALEAKQSCSSCRGPGPSEGPLLGVSAGRLIQGGQDVENKWPSWAGCQRAGREAERERALYVKWLFWIVSGFKTSWVPWAPLQNELLKNSLWTSLAGWPLVLFGVIYPS